MEDVRTGFELLSASPSRKVTAGSGKARWRNAILRLLAPLGAALARGDGLSPKLCRSGPVPPAPTLSLSPQGTSLYALWNVDVTSCPHTCARSLQFGPFLLPPGVRRAMATPDTTTQHSSIHFAGWSILPCNRCPSWFSLAAQSFPTRDRLHLYVAAHLPLYHLWNRHSPPA